MADGQLFKPEKDYTAEADRQILEAQELAKVAHRRRRLYSSVANTCESGQCSSRIREALSPGKAYTPGELLHGLWPLISS